MKISSTIAFHTLGCKLNYSESSALSQQFESQGYEIVPFSTQADHYVINTCSVTDFADKRCRQIVRRAKRINPDAKVIVTGCYAQLKPDDIAAMPGVDLVLGAAEKFRLVDHVNRLHQGLCTDQAIAGPISAVQLFNPSASLGSRTRSFVKVQDGCDYACSFCTIPLARGQSRSDTIDNVLQRVQILADQGVKEIVLTGINLGDFGYGDRTSIKASQKESLIDLLISLDHQTAIQRIRLSSIEPNLLNDDIIDLVASSSILMPHFHIPLQSGSNKILAAMRRRYKKDLYADRIQYIKAKMPHACIGVDVIVGFPGETDADFEETRSFIRDLDISYLHVFTYSERPDTLAASMEAIVPMSIRKKRNEQLRLLSDIKNKIFIESQLGRTHRVLFEKSKKEGLVEGYTENYVPVKASSQPFSTNEIYDVLLERINSDGCVEVPEALKV